MTFHPCARIQRETSQSEKSDYETFCLSCHFQEFFHQKLSVVVTEWAEQGKLRPFNLFKWIFLHSALRQRSTHCLWWILASASHFDLFSSCSLMFHFSDGFSCIWFFNFNSSADFPVFLISRVENWNCCWWCVSGGEALMSGMCFRHETTNKLTTERDTVA
jgi:hypothetical protein